MPTRRPLPFRRRPMTGEDTTSATIRRVEGWLVSLFFHGFLLSATLPLFRHVPIIIPTEPFRWEINLVRSTQSTQEPLEPAEARATEQQVASYTAPATIPAKVKHASRAPRTDAETNKPVSPIQQSAAAPESPLQHASPTAPMETTSIIQESAQSHNVAEEAAEPVSSRSASEQSSVPAPSTNDPPTPESEPTATAATPEQPVQAAVVTDTG